MNFQDLVLGLCSILSPLPPQKLPVESRNILGMTCFRIKHFANPLTIHSDFSSLHQICMKVGKKRHENFPHIL